MSQTSEPPDVVRHAEHLLQLVKSISTGQDDHKIALEPFTLWRRKIEVQAACDRVLESTMGPLEYTILLADSYHESQALHFVTTLGIPDLIGNGEAALAVLSEKACVLPQFLGATMSCLLGRGYFEEVGHFGSRVYRNNALSQVLMVGHPTSVKDAVGFLGDEGFRAASRLLDAAKPDAPGPAGNIAFGFSGTVFDWMASPEQAWRAERLGSAMHQLDRTVNALAAEDYPWHKLESPIVDVGGGVGSLEMSLLARERYGHLNFVIFDLPGTVGHARKIWADRIFNIPNQVSFVSGSFMAPTLEESNLPLGKPTYVIRHVLHDWNDGDVVTILRTLRQAMLAQALPGETSGAKLIAPPRLLIVEMLLQPTSSRFVRATSMHLLVLNNGLTRTQGEMEMLVRKAGFNVDSVTHMRAQDSVLEAVPVAIDEGEISPR